MNKIHPWLKASLVTIFILFFTSQPPKQSYGQQILVKGVTVDTVSLFEDRDIIPLLDSAKSNRDLMSVNSTVLKDGTDVIVRQTMLIEQQNKLISELERAEAK